MRAKEYLQQIKTLENELFIINEELKTRYYAIKSVQYDGIPGNRDLDASLHNAEKIIELRQKYEARLMELSDLRDEVIDTIRKIKNVNIRRVIYLRYCQHMPFKRIAQEMTYSEQRIIQLHKLGLNAIDGILTDYSKL